MNAKKRGGEVNFSAFFCVEKENAYIITYCICNLKHKKE